MKILIITAARSGSTYLYEVLAGYMAPNQKTWTRQHTDRMRFDEPIKDDLSAERNTNNVNDCLTQREWVIKQLVEDITPETEHLLLKMIRQSDLVVKLWRNPAERTISRLVANQDNEWGPKDINTDQIQVEYETVKREVRDTIDSYTRLQAQPADINLDYSQLGYPRQIASLVTGIPTNRFPPMLDKTPQNTMVFDVNKLVTIRDMMDRACDEFQHTRWEGMDWDRYLGKK